MIPIVVLLFGFLMNAGFGQHELDRTPLAVPAPPQLRQLPVRIESITPLAKPVAGDTTFFIRKDVNSSVVSLQEVAFYRRYTDEQIEIFVEVAEWDDGRVNQSSVLQVAQALLNQTPSASVNPDKGIWANEIEIFGDPPDVDQNGRLFVLLIDVRDGYQAGISGTYVAGYFDPLDQGRTQGNYADIIYIDTNPADVRNDATLAVVAHELQHLIHYRYDPDEAIWLNEGLSELAPRILGYPARSFALFLNDTNHPLTSFDSSLRDYAKVGLWTYYIYLRFGLEMIARIVADPTNSLASYQKVLRSHGYPDLEITSVMRDWFIANLLNDANLSDGRYGYGGYDLPRVSSPFFSANFTGGQTVEANLEPGAAQYIQFYSGKDIRFSLTPASDPNFSLAIVKHRATPEIQLIEPVVSVFQLNDPVFGSDYSKISFIPYRAIQNNTFPATAFSFSASGKGGFAEQEIIYDGDSLSFYIQLSQYEAAEKFILSSPQAILSAVKINTVNANPVTIKIYHSLESAPVATLSNMIPDGQTWTRFEVDTDIAQLLGQQVAISVSGLNNSLGYSHTGSGTNRAYLNTGNGFHNLSSFSVSQGIYLTGDWLIRAVEAITIVQPALLVAEPDSIGLWNNENQAFLTIRNAGSEELHWTITPPAERWLTIAPASGMTIDEYDRVDLFIDRNLMSPGIWETLIKIHSNGGDDSVSLAVLKRNSTAPQAAFLPGGRCFSATQTLTTLKMINIGNEAADFAWIAEHPPLIAEPEKGTIGLQDTVLIRFFLDVLRADQHTFVMRFFDGLDTMGVQFRYDGPIRALPLRLSLLPVIPNPFISLSHDALVFRYIMPAEYPVSLSIVDLTGREKYTQRVDTPKQGINIWEWDGRDRYGQHVPGGVYLVRLRQGERVTAAKFTILN